MEKLTSLVANKLVAFDSAPLIYYIEENPKYLPVADELFDSIDQGLTHGITSVLTLLEVLVLPLRTDHGELAEE